MRFILFILLSCYAFNYSWGQDLRNDKAFFKDQEQEYANWLKATKLDSAFKVKELAVYSDKIELRLISQYETDDSLKAAWDFLQRVYYKQNQRRIGEKLFDMLTFMCDIGYDSASITIHGRQFKSSKIAIYFKDYLREDPSFPQVMVAGNFDIEIEDVKLPHTNNVQILEGKQTVRKVKQRISDFIVDFYKDKGTPWLYNAHIDTSKSYYNAFTHRITCLSDEILTDDYFEFIEIKVEVQLKGDNIVVQYDIQGKFAPYFLCPKQREKFYKPIETYYPGKMKSYAEDLSRKIEEMLSK